MRKAVLLAVLPAGALLLLWRRCVLQAARIKELEQVSAKKELLRVEERSGRVAAEKELRRVMDAKLDTTHGYFVQPIGLVRSCFKTCLGTPRQGFFAPATRAKIEFKRNISPDALDGLERFSHVWIVFVFHQNTNGKNSRAHEGLRTDSHRHTFTAKIAPPMLKERVGIFSTRTPHRPNPVGITLATIERIDAKTRTVYLSGVDLVDGTPVLDIKPYVPAYDSVPDALVAPWVAVPQPHVIIEWEDEAAMRGVLTTLAPTSTHYRDAPDMFATAIEQVLSVDVRSRDQTRRMTATARVNRLSLDNALVEYVFSGDDNASESSSDVRLRITRVAPST